MTDSPDTPLSSNSPSPSSSAAQSSPTPPAQPSRPGVLQRLWTLVVRLLILGVSISLGWMAGLLVAQVWPSRNPNPPLQEQVMRQASQTVRKVRQLPQWWQGSPSSTNPVAESAPGELPPVTEGDNSAAPSAPPSALDQDVTALQQELTSLETRIAALEQQAGQTGTGSLEERLQRLAQATVLEEATPPDATRSGQAEPTPEDAPADNSDASTPEAAPDTPSPEPASEDPSANASDDAAPAAPPEDGLGRLAATPYTEPPFPLVSARIGLPSALLFEPGSSLLTPAGEQLLDAIVPDLRRYGSVTFLVGSHTDGPLPAAEARQLTFQQALAIQTYLAAQLTDTNSRWLTLGYGKTRPIAVGEDAGLEVRNQRIEIGIVQP